MLTRDLVLFLVVAVFSLRWLPVAAAAGPSSLTIWLVACVCLFVPLVVCVLDLARRFPEEGGLYAWVKRAFGEYPAFITGWTYWSSNLPFFPAVLYFAAGNALFFVPGGESLASSRSYFVVAALAGLAIAVIPNLFGFRVGKWVQNAGAIGVWLPAALVVTLGLIALWRFGSATPITATSLTPSLSLDNALVWSAIAFGFGGVETVSLVATQVRDPRRSIPRAVLIAAVIITATYVLGTLALLVALPATEIGAIEGVVQAVDRVSERVGARGLTSLIALLVTIGALGGVGAWFTATARLPYVAGIDRYLSPRFGVLHPRFGTPLIAMLAQAGIAALLIALGQAGTTVRGAYNVFVAMSVIAYFIPFLFMFAAAIRLSPNLRLPATIGCITIAAATALAFVPAPSEPNKALAIGKIVALTTALVASGTLVYARRARSGPMAL